MVADWVQDLLILQDRDSKCDGIQKELDAIPSEIASEQASIRNLEEQFAAMVEANKALEVRRLDLEGEVEMTEANIVKYKTQQLQVKKNEEYTALENEINNLKQQVSVLEDEELLLLEEIDLRTAELEATKKSLEQQRHTLEAHIDLMRKNLAASKSELSAAQQAVSDCEKAIDPGILQQYRYVKSQVKRPPVVVPLEEGRCQGCHLKVSGEVESEARKGRELIRCDSCGRILYYDR